MKRWKPFVSLLFAVGCATFLLFTADPDAVDVQLMGERKSDRKTAGEINFKPVGEGTVSTAQNETSPSMSGDGNTLVFARYADDWSRKTPFIASQQGERWFVEELKALGTVYNLSISNDGKSIVSADADDGELVRFDSVAGQWLKIESISEKTGVTGSYPQLRENGDLVFYDPDGTEGGGIYLLPNRGEEFDVPEVLFVPGIGTAFDGYLDEDTCLYFTWCRTTTCTAEQGDGIHVLCEGDESPKYLPELGYRWGIQPTAREFTYILTDGEDIVIWRDD
ncbi:MAG: hypothetical protein AAFR75_00125 [Pseudomonadota bacterium]